MALSSADRLALADDHSLQHLFLSSGLPFLTEARNMSPTEPAGKRLSLEPMPVQAIMYRFLAPVLSAQFMTDATGSEFVIFSLIPLRPPLALLLIDRFCLLIPM